MTSFPVAMPELNLVQDFLSGLTLPSLRKRRALSVKVDKDKSPIARVGLSSVLNSGRKEISMDSPIPEKNKYALGLAFEKDKALQQLIPVIKRRGF